MVERRKWLIIIPSRGLNNDTFTTQILYENKHQKQYIYLLEKCELVFIYCDGGRKKKVGSGWVFVKSIVWCQI